MSADISTSIARNVERVREQIARAAERAGRSADEVTLIAVTKSVGVTEVRALYDLGVRHFGENRPESAGEKVGALPPDAVWHAIGNLQRRKVKVALEHFQCIDGIDRPELAEALQAQAAEMQVAPRILLEVNVSREESKHGFPLEEVGEMALAIKTYNALRLEGLMTMAPFSAPEAELRRVFSALRQQADTLGLPVRSMGMTDDFEIAIEEGATEVRIGRALFE